MATIEPKRGTRDVACLIEYEDIAVPWTKCGGSGDKDGNVDRPAMLSIIISSKRWSLREASPFMTESLAGAQRLKSTGSRAVKNKRKVGLSLLCQIEVDFGRGMATAQPSPG